MEPRLETSDGVKAVEETRLCGSVRLRGEAQLAARSGADAGDPSRCGREQSPKTTPKVGDRWKSTISRRIRKKDGQILSESLWAVGERAKARHITTSPSCASRRSKTSAIELLGPGDRGESVSRQGAKMQAEFAARRHLVKSEIVRIMERVQ